MFDMTANDVLAVYTQLKDKYSLSMTHTSAVDDGFEGDFPILVGKAHGQIIWLYEHGGDFVLDVMDEAKTKGTHWYPFDVQSAIADITEFMDGKTDYELSPFKQQ